MNIVVFNTPIVGAYKSIFTQSKHSFIFIGYLLLAFFKRSTSSLHWIGSNFFSLSIQNTQVNEPIGLLNLKLAENGQLKSKRIRNVKYRKSFIFDAGLPFFLLIFACFWKLRGQAMKTSAYPKIRYIRSCLFQFVLFLEDKSTTAAPTAAAVAAFHWKEDIIYGMLYISLLSGRRR